MIPLGFAYSGRKKWGIVLNGVEREERVVRGLF